MMKQTKSNSQAVNHRRADNTMAKRKSTKRVVLDITIGDNVCQWHVASLCFSPGTPVSSTNKRV
jgi:hypothetical protein